MKKSKDNKRYRCVQCGEYMINSYGNELWAAPYCENPDCPNYGLLQTGIIFNEKK